MEKCTQGPAPLQSHPPSPVQGPPSRASSRPGDDLSFTTARGESGSPAENAQEEAPPVAQIIEPPAPVYTRASSNGSALAEGSARSSTSTLVEKGPQDSKTWAKRSTSSLGKMQSLPEDSHLVTWDDHDPANPQNWPRHRRWISTILIALFAFIALMSSTMVAPALDTISVEFKLRSKVEEFMVMSIFLLAIAIGPFLWGPLCDMLGRVRVIQGANLIFLLFTTLCGFARSEQQIMAFRFFAGIGASAPQAVGEGILTDCFHADQRGPATAIYNLMPFLSPALAPIIGGYMTQYVSWRWVFWTASIFHGVLQVFCFFLLRETHHPTLLAQKVEEMKNETGNPKLHTQWQSPDHTFKNALTNSCVRPFTTLATQPALQAMALFRAYQYGLMYLVFATIPMVFRQTYSMGIGHASLNYLSLSVGFVISLQISRTLQDKTYTWCKENEVDPASFQSAGQAWKTYRQTRTNASRGLKPLRLHQRGKSSLTLSSTTSAASPTGLPEYRLPLLLPFSPLVPVGLLIYGWSAGRTHWIVPNLGICIFSIGLVVCFDCAQRYFADAHDTKHAESATGAVTFICAMTGFVFPLFGPSMYATLGVGWGNSLLGFIGLPMGLVAPVVLWRYGSRLR